jgi:hypothetical protein
MTIDEANELFGCVLVLIALIGLAAFAWKQSRRR